MTEFFRSRLHVYFIENKPEADRIADQVLINKRSRETAEKARLNIKKKLTGSLDIANRVQKFVDCRTKDVARREIYIVEGDSALGSVKLSRDAEFQGIMSGEQKFKEGDGLLLTQETSNNSEILVFTDRFQVYKARCRDFEDGKASVLGDYLPGKLGFDEGENFLAACLPGNYAGSILFVFENGKAAKVELSAYDTKSNRRKLTGAYSDKSPLKALIHLPEERELALYSTDGRALVISSAQLTAKTTRSAQGVAVMTLRRKASLEKAVLLDESGIQNAARYRARNLPAAGAVLRDEDLEQKQITMVSVPWLMTKPS